MICSAFAEFRAECYAAIITTMVPITTQHESRMLLGARTEILRIKGEAECVSTAFHGVIAVVALDKTRMHPPICRRGRQKKKKGGINASTGSAPGIDLWRCYYTLLPSYQHPAENFGNAIEISIRDSSAGHLNKHDEMRRDPASDRNSFGNHQIDRDCAILREFERKRYSHGIRLFPEILKS